MMIPDVYLQQVFQAHSCSLLKRWASPRIPCRLPFHRNDDDEDDDGMMVVINDEADDEDYDEDDNEDDNKDGTHCGSPVAPCSSSLFAPTTSLLKHDIISKI